jgi:hypothetical protein
MSYKYISFTDGVLQSFRHEINGKVFDKHCLAAIEGGRRKAFELFGYDWCFIYTEEQLDKIDMQKVFPRGIIHVNTV